MPRRAGAVPTPLTRRSQRELARRGLAPRPACSWRRSSPTVELGRSAQVRRSAMADPATVHFERLVIEAGDDTFTLDLHPRLTVIAGVGRLEREGLITELIGGARQRPVGRAPRARVRRRRPLRRLPPGRRPATGSSTSTRPPTSPTVHRPTTAARPARPGRARPPQRPPAAAHQRRRPRHPLASRGVRRWRSPASTRAGCGTWPTEVKERERRLAERPRPPAPTPRTPRCSSEIERRHRAFELAQEAHERVRYLSFLVGAGAALVGVSARRCSTASGWPCRSCCWPSRPTVASIVFWQRGRAGPPATRRQALARGRRQLVPDVPDQPGQRAARQRPARRPMMQAAEEHRAALAEWQLLAGDIPVDWALEHRRRDPPQAARLRGRRCRARNPMAITMPAEDEPPAELAHALLAAARRRCSRSAPAARASRCCSTTPFAERRPVG